MFFNVLLAHTFLQGRKAEHIVRVVPYHKIHRGVAEVAHPVEEDYLMFFIFFQNEFLTFLQQVFYTFSSSFTDTSAVNIP